MSNTNQLVITLLADVKQMQAALQQASGQIAQLSSASKRAGDDAAAGFDKAGASAQNASASFSKTRAGVQSISEQLRTLQFLTVSYAAAQAALQSAQSGFELTDQYNSLIARLKLATNGQFEFNQAYDGLRKISRENGADLQAQAQLYNRLAGAVRNMGGTVQDTLKITEASALALRLSGATANEASAAILQFSQALGSGVLRGEEFNSINEQAPALLDALARGMDVNKESLRGLAEQGKLTSAVVGNALLKDFDSLKERAASLPPTVGQAFTELKNAIFEFVGQTDQAGGTSTIFANIVRSTADNLNNLMAVAKAAAIVFGSVFVSRGIGAGITATQAFITSQIASREAMLKAAVAAEAAAAAHVRQTAANLRDAQTKAALTLVQTDVTAAQIAATAATNAHATAQARLAATQSTVRTGLTAALGLLGGPVGIAATLAIAGGAWLMFGDNAEKGASAAEKAAKRSLDAARQMADTLASSEELDRKRLALELERSRRLDAKANKAKGGEQIIEQRNFDPATGMDMGVSQVVKNSKVSTATVELEKLAAQAKITSAELDVAATELDRITTSNSGKSADATKNKLTEVAQSIEALRGQFKTEIGIRKDYSDNLAKINLAITAARDKALANGDSKAAKQAEIEGRQLKQSLDKQLQADLKGLQQGQVSNATKLQLAKAQADAQLALQQDALTFAQAMDDAAYAKELLSLDQYYAQRLARQQQKIQLEKAALQDELTQAKTASTDPRTDANERAQAQVKIVEIEGRIQKLVQDANQAVALAGLELEKAQAEQLKKQADAMSQLVSSTIKINVEYANAKGELLNRTTVVAQLRDEYKSALKEFENSPEALAKLEAVIQIKADTRILEAQLARIEQNNQANMQPLDAQANAINSRVQSGAISNVRGNSELDLVKAEQVKQLQNYKLALEQARAALGDATQGTDEFKKALDLDAKISAVNTNLETLTTTTKSMSAQLEDSGVNNLANAFESIMLGSKSAKQAVSDLARAFIGDIAKMIAQALALKAVKAILGFAGGGAVETSVGAGAGGANSNSGNRFASGGAISGAGGPRDDAIPAWLSNGEHVIDAQTVQSFGGHSLFNALRAVGQNGGNNNAKVALSGALSRIGAGIAANVQPPSNRAFAFADGGAVAAASPANTAKPLQLVQQFNFAAPTDPRSQSQVAAAAFQGAQRAQMRNG